MANLIFNIALGRITELYERIDNNDPTNSAFILVAINTSTGDATLRDIDDLSSLLGDAGTAEATNSGYARKVITDTNLSAWAPDDTNDRVDLDMPDQTWTAVATSPGAWTDLVLCYDSDTTGGTDANIIPLIQFDFAVTPDGSDITAQVGANGFFRASE